MDQKKKKEKKKKNNSINWNENKQGNNINHLKKDNHPWNDSNSINNKKFKKRRWSRDHIKKKFRKNFGDKAEIYILSSMQRTAKQTYIGVYTGK